MPDPKMTKLEQLLVVQREVRAWVAEHPELRPEFPAAFERVREMIQENMNSTDRREHRLNQRCIELLNTDRLCVARLDRAGLAVGLEGPPTDLAVSPYRVRFQGWVSKGLNEAIAKRTGSGLDPRLQRLCAPWALAAVELKELRLRAKGLADPTDRETVSEAAFQFDQRMSREGLLPIVWRILLEPETQQDNPRGLLQFRIDDVRALSPSDRLAFAMARLGGLADIGSIDPLIPFDDDEFQDAAQFLAVMICFPARDQGGLSPEPDPSDLDPDMAKQLLEYAKRVTNRREGLVDPVGPVMPPRAKSVSDTQPDTALDVEEIRLTEPQLGVLRFLAAQRIARPRTYIADNLPANRTSVEAAARVLIELEVIQDTGRNTGLAITPRGLSLLKLMPKAAAENP